jgi:tetratricopeptide (TPR) repeat protein
MLPLLFMCFSPAHAQNLPPGTLPPDAQVEATPLAKAEANIAARKFADAQQQLLALTQQDPKDARALYDLGYVDEALHDDAAAATNYRAAIAADPKQFESQAALGLLLIDTDPTGATEALRTALTLTPATDADNARAEVLRALAHLDAAANPTAASDELVAAIKLTGETPQDTLLTAQIAAKLGDLADAESTYRRLLAATPNDPDTAYALANLLIREDRTTDAEPILTAAFQAHPQSVPLAAQLARVYELQGEDDKAIPLLEKQHAAHPQDAATTRMLADTYNRVNQAAQADELYQQLLLATPDDITLLTARGDSLIRQKKFGTAQEILQKADTLFLARPAALPATDDRVQLTGSLAFAASENAEYATVLTALDQRLQYAPETAVTLFLRATANDHLHHLPQARQFYQQFLAAAAGKYPNEEFEAKHRLIALKAEK